jgi:hypothetical protein
MTTLDEPARCTIKLKNGFESSSCTTESVLDATRMKCRSKCLSLGSEMLKGFCKERLLKIGLSCGTIIDGVPGEIVPPFRLNAEDPDSESKISNIQESCGLWASWMETENSALSTESDSVFSFEVFGGQRDFEFGPRRCSSADQIQPFAVSTFWLDLIKFLPPPFA